MGLWFSLANILNSSWLFAWLYEYTLISVFIMLGILFSLIIIIIKLNMENFDAKLPTIAFIWWPICNYSGWIAVATIANISAYLAKIGWSPLMSETGWALSMIIIAGLLNLLMIIFRNMREFALVGVWALVAIAVRHRNAN